MPLLNSAISELDTHVVLPVAKQVCHYICSSLNIRKQISNDIIIDTGWTSIKGTRDKHRFRTRGNSLYVGVELGSPKSLHWDYQNFTQAMGHQYPTNDLYSVYPEIFSDEVGHTHLYEVIMPLAMTFNCAIWSISRNEAYELPEKLYHRYTPGVVSTLTLSYDYPLPKDILSMLYSIYKYRRFDEDDGSIDLSKEAMNNFGDYVRKYQKAAFGTATSRTLKNQEIVIHKHIDNALLTFDFEGSEPTPQKQNNHPDYYEIPFTVKLQFGRPTELILDYSPIVDNQELPANMLPDIRSHDTPIASTLTYYPLELFDAVTKKYMMSRHYEAIQMPYYDTWRNFVNVAIVRSYVPIYIGLFTIDGDTTTIDLNDALGEDYELNPIVKEILYLQGIESFRYDCIFNISVYSDEAVLSTSAVPIEFIKHTGTQDADASKDAYTLKLNITTTSIHPNRRIVISEITNLKFLNPKWLDLYNKYKGFLDPNNNSNIDRYKELDEDGTYKTIRSFRWRIIPRRAPDGNS